MSWWEQSTAELPCRCIGFPLRVFIRRSHDRLIATMGFPVSPVLSFLNFINDSDSILDDTVGQIPCISGVDHPYVALVTTYQWFAQVVPGVFLGSSVDADNVSWMQRNIITHVVNCSAPYREYRAERRPKPVSLFVRLSVNFTLSIR